MNDPHAEIDRLRVELVREKQLRAEAVLAPLTRLDEMRARKVAMHARAQRAEARLAEVELERDAAAEHARDLRAADNETIDILVRQRNDALTRAETAEARLAKAVGALDAVIEAYGPTHTKIRSALLIGTAWRRALDVLAEIGEAGRG